MKTELIRMLLDLEGVTAIYPMGGKIIVVVDEDDEIEIYFDPTEVDIHNEGMWAEPEVPDSDGKIKCFSGKGGRGVKNLESVLEFCKDVIDHL